MVNPLQKYVEYDGPKGPVVLVIMDGVGIGAFEEGDMVLRASTPHLDWLKENVPTSQLEAHGTSVGMPCEDDMGNSEVGHNAIGCGRVFAQGARLVAESIDSRRLFEGTVWNELVQNSLDRSSCLHFIGLLSDGNVHSHIEHLFALLREGKARELQNIRVHTLLDGRDVSPTSALDYLDQLEAVLADLNADGDVHYAIASGGGRLKITMDRYEADWPMVAWGWDVHVRGEGPEFASAREAVEAHRTANPGILDQDLPPFVIIKDGEPVGPIQNGDSVVLLNFRGDRAMELTRAFTEDDFDKFDRSPRPDVLFVSMMQYDGDLQLPEKFLVEPPTIDETMGEYLATTGLRQFAISETQKYGHVTYFFNGNRTAKFDEKLETYVEVPSDNLPFEQRPWMKAGPITDEVLKAIESGEYDFIRLNYPNGDMVGHTGDYLAVEISVESVDLGLGRLMKAVERTGGILVVSADHGNADDMYERNKKTGEIVTDPVTGVPKPKTSHSLNPVPVHVYDPSGCAKVHLRGPQGLGISSLAATCILLLGYKPPEDYTPSIVELGSERSR